MAMLQDMKVSKEITITKKEALLIIIASISGALATEMYREVMDAFSVFNNELLLILFAIIFMILSLSMMIILISSAAYWIIKITDRKKKPKR